MTKVPRLGCRLDPDPSLIAIVTLTGHKVCLLHAFNEGRQGPRLHRDPISQVAHGRRAVEFPERDEDEILRVREAKRSQEFSVEPRYETAACLERQAELLIDMELRQIVGFRRLSH